MKKKNPYLTICVNCIGTNNMRIQNIQLSSFSLEKTLRQDYDFHSYNIQTCQNYVKFDELFDIVSIKSNCSDITEPFEYCEIGNVSKDGECEPVTLDFSNRQIEDEDYYKKIENGNIISVDKDDILLSKVRPNLKKHVRITDSNNAIFFTSAFIRLKPKKMPIVLYYCFRNTFYDNLMAIARQGKGYPTINEKDLRTLKFDKIVVDKLLANQDTISQDIIKIEDCINKKRNELVSIQRIIDKVFQSEFGFDYDKFEELKKIKRYNLGFANYSNNPDLRFSAKFHRPAGEYVENKLRRIGKKRFKHYLAEPIVLGASISPPEYDENGEYQYLSMATIKNWIFDSESAQYVADDYSDRKQDKTIKQGDIIFARSGEGTIGKVALIEDEDTKAVFADFTMRIRLQNYNKKFAYYYMRSTYFQYLVEIYKKGLGNNTNIFPIVIQEFPLPDISLEEQQRIVDEIKVEIDKQEEIKSQISVLRAEIDGIIEKVIS